MADEQTLARYRKLYALLVRLYPRPYRERFGEGIVQTFSDLCRERASTGKGLFAFVVWMFCETLLSITREYFMANNNILRIAIGSGLILLIPLVGQAPWSPMDFAMMGALLFGTGLTYELVSRRGGNIAYRIAVAIACVTGLLLTWVNAAVGIIGDEETANAMYILVLSLGIFGAVHARFQPRGMSRALFATAVAQALVPMIAMIWVPEERFSPGYLPVIGLNGVFVAAWLASALLFRQAANKNLATVLAP